MCVLIPGVKPVTGLSALQLCSALSLVLSERHFIIQHKVFIIRISAEQMESCFSFIRTNFSVEGVDSTRSDKNLLL